MTLTKNKEWHGSEEGEKRYKNYKLREIFQGKKLQEIFHSCFLFFRRVLTETHTSKHPRNPFGHSIKQLANGDMGLLGHEAGLHNYSLELLASWNT